MTIDIEQLSIDTIRTLSMDAVQKAKSGHPGTPMGLAPVAYTLWQKHLRYDPQDPLWANRDRFVLSVGHASMLLYSLLFLTGVKAVDERYEETGGPALTLDDIKHFRQIGSKTPGHPEYHLTSGVEATTGPLGQGCGMSVGMAVAGLWQAAYFNRPDYSLFDYRVWVLCGDGDMMEGVSSEAASLAGHLKLGNLCWIYDSNHISIEGSTKLAFTEDTGKRFEAYGWQVLHVEDANDLAAVDAALDQAKATTDRPTFIVVHSVIGYGAPKKQGTREAHGEPLGDDEIKAAKKFYGWPEDAQFLVPDGVREHFAEGFGARGHELATAWHQLFKRYGEAEPVLADRVTRMQHRTLPDGWDKDIPSFPADEKGIATRESSGKILNAVAQNLPWLIGGSADLSPSTKANLTFDGAGAFEPDDRGGRNFHYGVREHAMGALVNGLSLSKFHAYGSGFLIFSDYMRPAIRLSALMEIPSIWIFTHDSIGVGEDGPTHQPVEQLMSLRAIPGLVTIRPADANEAAEAWRAILPMKHQPSCLILSRQPLPTVDRSRYGAASGVAKGAYILADPPGGARPDVILIGTGSEVQLCVSAYENMTKDGLKVRVVSMPSWELFDRQDAAYRESVLPPAITARVSVEQGAMLGWERWVGMTGAKIGMNTFGASAPLKDLLIKFGFTAEKVEAAARAQIEGDQASAKRAENR
jgi:transketolase